ncbi:MAG: hypothetical protein KBD62_35115 [Kofleriaceae bacterium]|nr:hypothetical protein [Kofleriaceae bacterium]
MNPALAGLFVALTPDALEALGRILVTAGKVARLGGDSIKSGFLTSIVEGLSPDRVAETAAHIIGAELDALQLQLDVSVIQGLLLAQEASAVGARIPDVHPVEAPPYDR